jgi:hypothetical protein
VRLIPWRGYVKEPEGISQNMKSSNFITLGGRYGWVSGNKWIRVRDGRFGYVCNCYLLYFFFSKFEK